MRVRGLTCGLLMLAWAVSSAMAGVTPFGSEYRMTLPMSGDQVFPDLALGPHGGLLVWQDNRTDGEGYGVSARWLDLNMVGAYDPFRVNELGAGDQENPRAALFPGGGAIFVWQGGELTEQHIYARVLRANGTFTGGDLPVSDYPAGGQQSPAVAVLQNGDAIVVWESQGQDGQLLGVYGRRISRDGVLLGPEFQVNQFTLNNQRTPDVEGLSDGGFVVAWVTEKLASVSMSTAPDSESVDGAGGALNYEVQLVSRRYAQDGTPLSGEVALSSGGLAAANPSLARGQDGRLMVVWSSRKLSADQEEVETRARWDILVRGLGADGSPLGEPFRVNNRVAGDQYLPKLAALGDGYQVVWTSLGQDGSREGVFGRSVRPEGVTSDETQVNSIAVSQQLHPTVGSTDGNDALVVWASFAGVDASFDLVGQRISLIPSLAAPSAPFVQSLSQSRLMASWPRLEGLDVAAYLLFVDDSSTPIETLENRYYLNKLAPATEHTFRLAYRLADGQVSPLSSTTIGLTWGEDNNYDVLPDDWQIAYWGESSANWGGPSEDSDGDGATNLQELLAGTDPTDESSVLMTRMETTPQGIWLRWNTQPGSLYQVQAAENGSTWNALGSERFAAGTTDSVLLPGGNSLVLYRVVRIR